MNINVSKIIKSPHITEKATFLSTKGKYCFIVYPKATKNEIKKAIKNLYNVEVEKVNIVNIPRKQRRRGRFVGFKSGYKKAIITLKGDQKIEVLPH